MFNIIESNNKFDDSEISSTKAEFGDESSASCFSTLSEFCKTGVSNIDFSYAGSEREDFDAVKDPMTTSMTPSDFKEAFDNGPDLNKVHDLNYEFNMLSCKARIYSIYHYLNIKKLLS